MADQRIAGLIQLKLNGEIRQAIGNFSYSLGRPVRRALPGADGIHGYAEEPQVPFIEGEIRDRGDLDLDALVTLKDALVVLRLGNGKTFMLGEAWFTGDGTANSLEANIPVRFEGMSAEEIGA